MDLKKTFNNAWETVFPANAEKKEVENAVKKITSQIKRQHSLYRKEIKEWKMSKIAALDQELPRRANLIMLYIDIMEDAFIFGRWNNRKLRISNKAVQVVNGGEVDDDKTKLFKKLWFNMYLKHFMDSKAFGPTLVYPKNIDEDGFIKDIDIVPRTNVVPETCEILKNVYDQSGARFDESPYREWCLLLGDPKDLGLLNKAAPLWIFKKHSWQNWDEFEEMFGVPMRIAKVASSDKRVQAEVQKWLKSLGSAAYGIFQEGTEVEIIESKSKDAFNVFNEKRKAVNEEIAILFDGQFESSTESGSNAKAGIVIQKTQEEITKDDATTALFSINEQLLPFLIQRGYPFSEDDEVQWNDNKETTPKERLDIFKGVKDLGYSVKKEQIETELDVELDESTPPEPPKPPSNFNVPHNQHIGCGAHLETYRIINLDITNNLTNDEEELLRQIWKNRENINWNYKEFMATHGKLLSSIRSGFGNIDFDFESSDHLVVEALQSNIHRFGTDKTQKQIYDLNKIIKDTDVDTFEKFFKRAQKVFPNYKRTWANAEWNQAYGTSQAAARHRRYLDNADIAPFWQYKTVADDRVRPEHWKLHNKVFRKTDVDAWKFIAPNGWSCRCDDIELIDYDGEITSYQDAIGLDPEGYEKMVKSGHNVNWGNQKEVFTATQRYLHGLSISSLDVSNFDFKTFNLNSYKTMFKSDLIDNGKINFNDFKDRSGLARFNTIENLPVWLSKESFDHISDDIKHQLPEVLQSPDEVYWSDSENKKLKSYFKHYKDGSLEALIDIDGTDKASIFAFVKHKNPDAFRKGLLIYTPEAKKQYQLQLYNEFDDNYTKEFFNAKNGGFVVTHKNHGKGEYEENKHIATELAKKGKGIELQPILKGQRNFDAKVDGIEWEFKGFKKETNLRNRITKDLREKSKQSPNVLLYIDRPYTFEDLSQGIYNSINEDMDKRRLQFVAVLFKDGRLVQFSRKQIQTGEFNKLLKK